MDIRVTDLSFTYPTGVVALRGVSFEIRSGETVAIVGQNGAGKTTLAKHFNALLKPSAGIVQVGEWDTRHVSTARLAARVGFAFQNPDEQLFQPSVWKEMLFGPRNLGWDPARAEVAARAALKLVGLEKTAEKHPYDLPFGQRKRVALASVLAMDTPIVVLDEPTTGQDYAGAQMVGEITDRLVQQGKTVIVITHDLDFCAEHFARAVVMGGGQVLLDGPACEVLAQADVLAQTAVEPPQIARLALRLGLEPPLPMTVEELVGRIKG